MKATKENGTIYTYTDFRQEAIKPRRTERAQRQEIESSLKRLTEQGDYWSLDLIRQAATVLTDEGEAGQVFHFLLREIITAKPGEWIIHKKALQGYCR